jgi:hypothetical protein
VKSSAVATAAITATFFMAIFRSLRVPMHAIYAHLQPNAVMGITSATGFDIYVMAITSLVTAKC